MATEKTFTLDKQEEEFINSYASLGFNHPNEMIKKGLALLKEEIQRHQELSRSADLYAELYDNDQESKDWTSSATQDWE